MTMQMRIGAIVVALSACLSACTSPNVAAGTTTNSASIENSCINPIDIKKQTIVSDTEIRFELRNGEVWTNTMARACPGLKFRQGFSWDVRGTLVCSNQQTITVKDEGTVCQLGVFTRAPKASN